MQRHPTTSDSSVKPVRLQLNPITIASEIFLGSALLLINLHFCLPWWHFELYAPWETYEHGWPVTYMVRELQKDADMAGICYDSWPFFDDPPLVEFYPAWLAFDIVIAILLIVLTSQSVESWLRVRQVRLRFSLRLLLGLTGLASVFCALFGHLVVRHSPGGVEVAEFALGFCAGIVVLLAICLSGVFLIRSILTFLTSFASDRGRNHPQGRPPAQPGT